MRTNMWKWLGVAGIAGVAATGAALVARGERERRAYTPEDIRARLHERAVGSSGRDPAAQG
ncbi:hypothetical protein [Nakamurella sp.]|uniref:hypothetical protein n=1 Tax=Nakamurella sp. TaxID=1869182 RepID=UPI003B3B397E